MSLDAQRAKLAAYAAALDLQLVDIVSDEGVSAGTLKRPGLQAALRMLETGRASVLLVCKLDRLSRSVRDLGDLCERYFTDGRCSLLSVSDSIDTRTASGRLVLNVLGSIAEWERQAISERTREALATVRAQGFKFGQPPLGYRWSSEPDEYGRKRWEVDAAEQHALRRLLELHDAGNNVPRIVETLNTEGATLRRAQRWHKTRVFRVLRLNGREPAMRRSGGARRRFIEAQPHDRDACRRVAEVLQGQGLSLRQIIAVMERQRLTPPGGRRWHASTVATILRRRS